MRNTFYRLAQTTLHSLQSLLTSSRAFETSSGTQQPRLLSALLLPLIILNVIVLITMLLSGSLQPPILISVGLSGVMAGVIFTLNHRGNYWIAAWLLVGVIYVSIVTAVVVQTSPRALIFAPNFLILVVLLSSQLLSSRATAYSAAASIVFLLLLLVLRPAERQLLILGPATLVPTVSLLILVSAHLRYRDQTRLKHQSTALLESEDRYRNLLKMTSEGVIIHNNGRILDANETCEQLFGCALHEVVGQSVLQFVSPESRAEVIHHEYILGQPFEILAQRKNGEVFPVELIQRATIYRGEMVRAAVIRDVTDRQQSERRMLELAVERERVSLLHRFISDASHDFRNPLTNIKTSLYLLKRLADNPDKQLHYLGVMEENTGQLERLLDDMLMMSRLEQLVEGFIVDPLDLNELLHELISVYEERFTRVNIDVNYDPGSIMPVWADKEMLALAISNLLNNAINYAPEGSLHLRTTLQDSDFIILDIEDNGMGIESDDLPRVFDSFFRADTARGSNTGGTGLGLPIAKKIIEAHRGQIHITSTPGQGTKVRVVLPAAQEPAS